MAKCRIVWRPVMLKIAGQPVLTGIILTGIILTGINFEILVHIHYLDWHYL